MIRFRLLVLLVALLFSTAALHHAGRLHPDEAFYLTFARNAAVRGDWWLVSEPVDKPPLTFYSNALAMVLFAVKLDANGVHQLDPLQGEFAGRMSAFLLSIVLVALVMRVAHILLQKREAALLAGALVALSPLRIAFAATAFTDLPMLTLATAGLWMAAKGRWMFAGCWMALAFAAKPQVIFLFPLLLLGWRFWRGAWRFFIPMLLCVLLLALWDQARMQQGAESFWLLGQQRYPAIALLPPSDWNARLLEIWASLGYLFGSPLLTGIISSAALIAGAFHEKTQLLAVWIAGFIVIHSISSLNIYDRNLIVVLPPLALLAGWMLTHPLAHRLYAARWLLALILLGAWQAAAGNLPIGGDDGRHDGIDQLAVALNNKPVATVIYDRWLDWELDYYMGVWTDKRRVYYHTASELVAGALALPESGTRYLVAPDSVQIDAWLSALQSAGFETWLDQEIAAFRIYGLRPP
jgi:4-amino-4-deoxy-L-arabinose transferase-like glycosyltransferase